MNGLELFLLGRTLMKIGEEAIPRAGFHQLPSSVRSILIDVFEHPNTSIGEITGRTGFPQSHVSASVARLREAGALETAGDPKDRRRTLVRPSPAVVRRAAQGISSPIDGAIATALGAENAAEVSEIVATLERLGERLNPRALNRLTSPMAPPGREEFDVMYAATPPWDIGRPQPAFLELAEEGAIRGRVLDVGCGTGEHALMAAELGLDATGIDIAPAAISKAEGKARDRNLKVRFLVGDALELAGLDERFDTVLDSGLFHVFGDEDRLRYVESLRAAIPAGGRYFLVCFSDRQPGVWGPRRVSEDEITASFADGWHVDAIEAATMDITFDPSGVLAWRAALTRA